MKKIFLTLLLAMGSAAAFAQSGDSDCDGIADSEDLCPALAGPASNKGCPEKSVTTGAVQPASAPAQKDCFPSGTSLVGAAVSSDGNYARVLTVRDMWKYFDTRTARLVAASTTYNKEFEDQYIPEVGSPRNYELNITTRPAKDPYQPDKTFTVRNTKGDVVATYETTGQTWHEFNPIAGALFVTYIKGKKDPTVLLRPNQEPIQLFRDGFLINGYHILSPDGRYIVFSTHTVIDLEKGRATNYADKHPKQNTQGAMGFRSGNNTEYFAADDVDGIVTYSCETGQRLSNIPVPASLPRIPGFLIVPAANGKDFLYYMNFYNKTVAGLAYWVHDGVGTSLCDPSWRDEQTENWMTLLREAGKRLEQEAANEAEAERKRALENEEWARSYATREENRRRQAQEAERQGYNAGSGNDAHANDCDACDGTGTVMRQTIAYTKSTREYSSGAGSGSVNYRVTSTPVYSQYPSPTTCTKCGGTGKRRR